MIINIKAITKALENLNIDYEFLDENKNVVRVMLNNRPFVFKQYASPVNTQTAAEIAKDKEFTYLTIKDLGIMPKIKGYMDPNADSYQEYIKLKTYDDVIHDIESEFSYPVIIKRNKGSRGDNVFKCNSRAEVKSSLKKIFENKKNYDYVALAQEYVEIESEYRVVVLNKRVQFVYIKDVSNATFRGNLSPLHWEDSKAVLIDDAGFIAQAELFIKSIFNNLDLAYCGLDVVEDKNGNLSLLEINSTPNYEIFIRDNGMEQVVKMYEKMIRNVILGLSKY